MCGKLSRSFAFVLIKSTFGVSLAHEIVMQFSWDDEKSVFLCIHGKIFV